MWEKAAFVAYYIGLCMAQREAMTDLRARQAPPSSGGSGQLVKSPLPPSPTLNTLVPRQPQFTPGVSSAGPNVFTTVLFPSVPTVAPTGVVVPIYVTYTGTLVPTEVPSGFQWTPPASVPGTHVPTISNTIPTTFNRPTTAPVIPTSRPTSMSIPFMSSSWTTRPSSTTSRSSQTTSSTRSSTTSSTISSTSSSTSSTFTSSTSTISSSSSSASATDTNLANNGASPHNTHALSSRSIAGIVVGLVSGAILVIALVIFLWSRNNRNKRAESPGIYPQEAYLYDPPVTPPPVPRGGPGGNGGDFGRALSPERPGAERENLLGGAALAVGGVGAAAAVGRGRAESEARPPQQWNGYSPVESRDVREQFGPIAGPSSSSADPFSDPRYELGAAAAGTRWPLNPNADSGLKTPPGSPAGRPSTGRPSTGQPSAGRPSTARSQGTGTPPGPSISGVGSSRYERTLSSSGPGSPGGGVQVVPSPQMRELRKAWGMDQ